MAVHGGVNDMQYVITDEYTGRFAPLSRCIARPLQAGDEINIIQNPNQHEAEEFHEWLKALGLKLDWVTYCVNNDMHQYLLVTA